ncbi:MAG: hypothetical protein ACRDD8_11070 [Bacteroidales bacterium]
MMYLMDDFISQNTIPHKSELTFEKCTEIMRNGLEKLEKVAENHKSQFFLLFSRFDEYIDLLAWRMELKRSYETYLEEKLPMQSYKYFLSEVFDRIYNFTEVSMRPNMDTMSDLRDSISHLLQNIYRKGDKHKINEHMLDYTPSFYEESFIQKGKFHDCNPPKLSIPEKYVCLDFLFAILYYQRKNSNSMELYRTCKIVKNFIKWLIKERDDVPQKNDVRFILFCTGHNMLDLMGSEYRDYDFTAYQRLIMKTFKSINDIIDKKCDFYKTTYKNVIIWNTASANTHLLNNLLWGSQADLVKVEVDASGILMGGSITRGNDKDALSLLSDTKEGYVSSEPNGGESRARESLSLKKDKNEDKLEILLENIPLVDLISWMTNEEEIYEEILKLRLKPDDFISWVENTIQGYDRIWRVLGYRRDLIPLKLFIEERVKRFSTSVSEIQ